MTNERNKREEMFRLIYGTFYLTLGRIQLRLYFKWNIWTKKYYFLDFAKVSAGQGFLVMCWPVSFVYSEQGFDRFFDSNATSNA